MTNSDNNMDADYTVPPEIETLYQEKLITSDEVQSLLDLRNDLVNAAPQPRQDFQNQLAQRLIEELKQQQSPVRNKNRYNQLHWRIAVAVIAILTVSMGTVLAVNGILQQFISYDAGLNTVFTAGGGIELNQSQTVGNYTIKLEWLNADNNRLTLGFTVSGLVCPEDLMVCDVDLKVSSQDGQDIPMLDGKADESDGVFTYLYNFDLSNYTPDTITNTFQLQVIPYGMTNDGTEPSQPNVIRGRTIALSEPIILPFSVPISNKIRVYNTPQSATDKNVTVTLRRVLVSSSQTRIALCFVPPVTERNWISIPYLTTNGTEVAGGGSTDFVHGIGESNAEICNEHIYNVALFDYLGQWQLDITELIGFGTNSDDQQRVSGLWRFEFVIP